MITYTNFKLAKEGVGNSSGKYVSESRHTLCVDDCIWKELNITNMIPNRQQNNLKAFAHLPVKTRLPKQDHSKSSVSLEDKLPWFFLGELYEQRISYLHVVIKDLQFSRPKFILGAKLRWPNTVFADSI